MIGVDHSKTSAAAQSAQALVRIPSVNPHYDPASAGESAVVDWIESWAHRHGISAKVVAVLGNRSNIVLSLENGAPRPHLLLTGHTDTVAVNGMTIPPFEATISGGRLFGRGSADMKGSLAAMLHALLILREQRAQWRGTVSVACVIDEEYQARGIKALMAAGEPSYDYAVVGEPSRMMVVRGCKGCLRFAFEAIGAAAHSSTPELGRSAIIAMAEAVLALDLHFRTQLAAVRQEGFGCSTGSVGLIEGGSGINIVPGVCRASVDVRLIPGQRWEDVYGELQTCVRQETTRLAGVKWNFDETPFTDPSFETAESHPLVRTALSLGEQSKADIVAYSCDASKIAAAGVPCVILGPGDIAQAHTANESISLDEIDAAVIRYAALARRLLPVT